MEKVTQAINSTESFTYDFVELAPDVFSIIRKINSLHEKTLKLIFSQENLEKLHVRVSSAKGGQFYIFPEQGGLILKSITNHSYKALQDLLPKYFKHILMNPTTLITPILGAYMMKLNRDGIIIPIYFILQRAI